MVAVILTVMVVACAAAMTFGARANRIRQQNTNIYKQAKRHKYPKK